MNQTSLPPGRGRRGWIGAFLVYLIFSLPLYAFPAFSEPNEERDISVSGTVVGSNGEPIPGVSVIVKGTAMGVATDIDGQFSLTVPSSSSVLVFSFLGYTS